MYKKIEQNGWNASMILLMQKPGFTNVYLCIDGMHRIEALRVLSRNVEQYKDYKPYCHVMPYIDELDQVTIAEGFLNYLLYFVNYINKIALNYQNEDYFPTTYADELEEKLRVAEIVVEKNNMENNKNDNVDNVIIKL